MFRIWIRFLNVRLFVLGIQLCDILIALQFSIFCKSFSHFQYFEYCHFNLRKQ